jgi:nucleotide-binding universal stress UspA family protein
MFSRILVATDGSDTAWKALKYAVELAKQTGSMITAISVIDRTSFLIKSVPAVATPTHLIEPVEDYMRQAAEAYLEKAESLCRKSDVKFRKVIRAGHPVDEIVKEAEKSKVDLIIMGSRGRGILRSAVLGSTTFGVMNKETKVPLLMVRK